MPTSKPILFNMKKVNGVELKQRAVDGYIDAIAICDACDKDFSEYMQIRFTRRFLSELSRDTGISESDLIKKEEHGDSVWVHPRVAINLSQWASTKLAVLIPKWVIEWSLKNKTKSTPTVKEEEFISPTGVKFEDIDPEFTSWIAKAAKYNPKEEE